MTTLVLREMQEAQIQSFEEDPEALQDACDVAAFVFDGSNIESFKAALDLLLKLAHLADDTIPCVLIAAKDDLGISMVSSALVNPLDRLCAALTFKPCMLLIVLLIFLSCFHKRKCAFYHHCAASTSTTSWIWASTVQHLCS